MSQKYEIKSQSNATSAKRPRVTSYDSCDEHSIEHWIDLRLQVEEFEEETTNIVDPQESGR